MYKNKLLTKRSTVWMYLLKAKLLERDNLAQIRWSMPLTFNYDFDLFFFFILSEKENMSNSYRSWAPICRQRFLSLCVYIYLDAIVFLWNEAKHLCVGMQVYFWRMENNLGCSCPSPLYLWDRICHWFLSNSSSILCRLIGHIRNPPFSSLPPLCW